MYKTEIVKIEQIKLNPNNPRKIKAEQFEKLKQSIIDFPKMLHLRTVVVDENFVVLGGNMRLLALQKLGFREITVTKAIGLTEEEKKEFIIKDNLSFGIWDYEMLGAHYDHETLMSFGFPDFDAGGDFGEDKGGEEGEAPSDGKPTIKLKFSTVADLEACKKEIEPLLSKYEGVSLTTKE